MRLVAIEIPTTTGATVAAETLIARDGGATNRPCRRYFAPDTGACTLRTLPNIANRVMDRTCVYTIWRADSRRPFGDRMSDWEREKKAVQEILDEHSRTHPDGMRVLEAGCGSASRFVMPAKSTVDGIDISERQLERNTQLANRFLGDLQEYDLSADTYGLVICWDVLEHLPRPEDAMRRMFNATRPGGLLVFAMPNVYSLEAQVTKWTPLWFHTAFYRHILGQSNAGHDDVGPFKTFLRRSTSLRAIESLAREHGLQIVYQSLYARSKAAQLKEKSALLYAAYAAVGRAGQVVTLGKLEPKNSSSLIVLRKPAM